MCGGPVLSFAREHAPLWPAIGVAHTNSDTSKYAHTTIDLAARWAKSRAFAEDDPFLFLPVLTLPGVLDSGFTLCGTTGTILYLDDGESLVLLPSPSDQIKSY